MKGSFKFYLYIFTLLWVWFTLFSFEKMKAGYFVTWICLTFIMWMFWGVYLAEKYDKQIDKIVDKIADFHKWLDKVIK